VKLYGRQGGHALVDDHLSEWLGEWRWHANSRGYVVRTVHVYIDGRRKSRTVLMHREILGLAYGDPRQGDHEDGNKLDNRGSNLRIAHRGQLDNQQNRQGPNRNGTSGYRGVTSDGRGRWQAQVGLGRRLHHLGRFDTPEAAAAAAEAFREAHMEFAR
jgi:hypothetical protein